MGIKKRVISICMAAATVASMIGTGAVTASAASKNNNQKLLFMENRMAGYEVETRTGIRTKTTSDGVTNTYKVTFTQRKNRYC